MKFQTDAAESEAEKYDSEVVEYIKELHEQLKTKEDQIETIKEEIRCKQQLWSEKSIPQDKESDLNKKVRTKVNKSNQPKVSFFAARKYRYRQTKQQRAACLCLSQSKPSNGHQ